MQNRRRFLKLASAGVVAAMFPSTLLQANETQRIGRKKLILLTLEGGCDTLNMFIPNRTKAEESEYLALRGAKAKTNIAIDKKETLPLEGTVYSLHPKMKALHNAWNRGNLALFPATHSGDKSNTSHFYQFDFFDRGAYGDAKLRGNSDGWLARYLNEQGKSGNGLYAYNFATGRNMFRNANSTVFGNTQAYALNLSMNSAIKDSFAKTNLLKHREGKAGMVFATQKSIFERIDRLKALDMTKTSTKSFRSLKETGRAMTNAIEMLRGIDEMEVVQMSMGGFDTHTRQLANHDRLFFELNEALGVFNTMLTKDELDNTLLIVQTEFSRTLDANGTNGTDHGKAAMWFAMGGEIKKGVYGKNSNTCLTGTVANSGMDDTKYSSSKRYYMNQKNDYRDLLAKAASWLGASNPEAVFDLGSGISPYHYTDKLEYLA